MFKRFHVPPATVATSSHNGGMNNNPGATDDPNITATGQGGPVHGFVFTKWVRLHLVDLITMGVIGAVGLGVYYARKLVLPQCTWIR